jgi:hypothetical protein
MDQENTDQIRDRIAALADEIKEWDADRKRLSHIENHEGGAYGQWHDSDDRAVEIVRAVQEIIGEPSKARPVKYCSPGKECPDCAAVGD